MNEKEMSQQAIGKMICEDDLGRFELFIEDGNIKIWRDTSNEKYYCSDGRKNAENPEWHAVEYVISVNKEKWDAWDFSRDDEDFITDSVAFCEICLTHEINGVTYNAWFEIID